MNDLSVKNGCLLLGNKVIIPKILKKDVLELFHEQHLGVVRTKMLVCSFCWWISMNEDVERIIGSCDTCQQTHNFTNKGALMFWPKARNNFERVNIDFFQKYNLTFLILVDSKSKWVDVKLMDEGTSASQTVLKFKEIFAIHGLPVELVSDNGPPFNSVEFLKFCQINGIVPMKSPHYHLQINGIAERAVQTIKKGLEKSLFCKPESVTSKNLVLHRLAGYLFIEIPHLQ